MDCQAYPRVRAGSNVINKESFHSSVIIGRGTQRDVRSGQKSHLHMFARSTDHGDLTMKVQCRLEYFTNGTVMPAQE